ncbi:DUF3558 family protein [Demequina sp.]|uniref:DUF3558 family protein n=1 Tax=Demequina sp. TaxID=2050685 RepID=UPI0025E91D2A|nr:DUF3558 family protein [Demequina sp.]
MSHRLPPVLVGAAAAAALLLGGCTPAGGGVDSSASPSVAPTADGAVTATAPEGTPDPCTLLTAEFLQEATGFKMLDGTFNAALSNDGRNICTWNPASTERNVPRIQVEVNWGFPDAAGHREIATQIFGDLKNVEIEGATNAYAYPGYRTEAMEVGQYFVKVSYIHPNRTNAGQITTAIATETVKNLG